MPASLFDRVTLALGHQYHIDSEIGRGGMSVVYRARDLRLNRDVAIKVLPPELAHDAAVGTRFMREAQTSAQLSHPHIVPIYDVGEFDGIAYFVMALVTGGNLAMLLERQARRPVDEVRMLLGEVADALAYAHLRGVIHRDIKADNILLDADTGRAMVTDFGIARAVEGGSRLTMTGIAVGTPTYMSPEQAVGEREIDGRSDIYSLGVLGYQMLTGRVPFVASNSMALLLKHVSERPKPVADLRPEAPRALCEAIERALMKFPEERWPTATAFREALSSEGQSGAAWRADRRDPVRYVSPIPRSVAREGSSVSHRERIDRAPELELPTLNGIVLEPAHLVSFTPEQREDLRLWNGRVNLLDRVKFARRFFLLTSVTTAMGMVAFVAGVDDGNPLFLAPLIPLYMMYRLWTRAKSLRMRGLKLRRVFFRFRARSAFPPPATLPGERQLEKLASREVLNGTRGSVIRRAVDCRSAIGEILQALSKGERALLPDVEQTVNALVDRVAQLAQMLHRLDTDFDPRMLSELEARIAAADHGGKSVEDHRRLTLLRRQRDTVDEIARRRETLAHQIESAVLALDNLRLDLIRMRSSGFESGMSGVTSATQEARVLSREIGIALEAVAEVRAL